MTANSEYKICKLCSGKSIKDVLYRLELMDKFIETKKLKLRVSLVNLTIGEENVTTSKSIT